MPPRKVPPAVRSVLAAGKKRVATAVAATATSKSSSPPPKKRKASATSAPTSAEPKRDSAGRLVFSDFREFRPRLTPSQMIRAGVFGGCYFNPRGGKPGILHPKGIDVSFEEFPPEWFAGVPESHYNSRRYQVPVNKHRCKAGQTQAFWEEKGWMDSRDPRGWFQWYCRFYCGRRLDDGEDERQVSRWNGVAGAKGRWRRALANKCAARGLPASRAGEASPVIAQTLLHWADVLTEADVAAALKRMKNG